MRAQAQPSALHDEMHEVFVVDVALRVLLPLQQLLHLRNHTLQLETHYIQNHFLVTFLRI